MHKKTIVSILCLSLSLSIFATGCGNKDGVNNQSKIENKSSTTVQDSNNKQNSIEKEKTTTSNTNNLSTKEEDWFFEPKKDGSPSRSEEHTSELQSRQYLVCRLLLEKKKYKIYVIVITTN